MHRKKGSKIEPFLVLENPWLDQGFRKAYSYGTYNKNSF